MKFIDRNSVQPPASLCDPDSKAAKERERAKRYYEQTPAPRSAFEFHEYKAEDVVKALRQLFGGKCAYCETKVTASQPVDVDHYRPKGAVAEDPAHPGYWWLALEWENLLPSCIDCNRNRKQYLFEIEANGAPMLRSLKEVAGKQDAFPIRGLTRACKPDDDLAIEDPLLIDPSRQDPDAHLRWDIDALSLPIVLPRVTDGESSIQGETSIKVHGLNRQGLVEERGSLLKELGVEFERLRKIFGLVASMPAGAKRAAELVDADKLLEEFRRHGEDTRRYSAVAKIFVHHAVARIREEFKDALAEIAKVENDRPKRRRAPRRS